MTTIQLIALAEDMAREAFEARKLEAGTALMLFADRARRHRPQCRAFWRAGTGVRCRGHDGHDGQHAGMLPDGGWVSWSRRLAPEARP